jgi:hypothetical protein
LNPRLCSLLTNRPRDGLVRQSLHPCLQFGERQPGFPGFPCEQRGASVPLPGGCERKGLSSTVERIIWVMIRRSIAVIVYPLLLVALVVPETAAQKPPEKAPGLHAGIHARIIPPSTDTPSVMLLFVLLSDSEKPLEVETGSWRLVLNGRELNDSGILFGNGPTLVRRVSHPKAGRVVRVWESASDCGIFSFK